MGSVAIAHILGAKRARPDHDIATHSGSHTASKPAAKMMQIETGKSRANELKRRGWAGWADAKKDEKVGTGKGTENGGRVRWAM